MRIPRSLTVIASALACGLVVVGTSFAQERSGGKVAIGKASDQLNALAPENESLKQSVGQWDVIETVWQAPGSAPVTTTGLVADRRMVGSALEEFMHPADDTTGQRVERIDYLRFNGLSGQWEYMSIDTRADIGLMPAKSFTRADPDGRIVLVHDPFVIPAKKPGLPPVTLRMDSVLSRQGPDHDIKEQHFVTTDGTEKVWLAHRYEYTRRK
jgi:hypothetical protein